METYLFRKRISITPPNSRGTILDQRGKDFTKDIKLPLRGTGILAGQFPDGITSIEGEPTPATVRVLYRPEPGAPGDGAVVAEVQSNQDGTWMVEGLNPELKFDVVGRKSGFNDVIMANVSPYSSEYLQLDGTFTVVKPERNALEGRITVTGGTAPYTVDVVAGAAPAGIAFSYFYGAVEAAGTTEEWGDFEFTLRVTDVNGVWAEILVELESVDGQWDKVEALLRFDDNLADEKTRTWTRDAGATTYVEGKFGQALDASKGKHRANTPVHFLDEDFTIEFWYKGLTNSLPDYTAVVINRTRASSNAQLYWGPRNSPNSWMFQWSANGSAATGTESWIFPDLTDDFHHIALCREGNQLSVYLDGVFLPGESSPKPAITGSLYPSTERFVIGGMSGSYATYYLQAAVDELRITKGLARYTEDFTPPKAPF